jgi:hypothetical protein
VLFANQKLRLSNATPPIFSHYMCDASTSSRGLPSKPVSLHPGAQQSRKPQQQAKSHYVLRSNVLIGRFFSLQPHLVKRESHSSRSYQALFRLAPALHGWLEPDWARHRSWPSSARLVYQGSVAVFDEPHPQVSGVCDTTSVCPRCEHSRRLFFASLNSSRFQFRD